jgi:hypothetical protein
VIPSVLVVEVVIVVEALVVLVVVAVVAALVVFVVVDVKVVVAAVVVVVVHLAGVGVSFDCRKRPCFPLLFLLRGQSEIHVVVNKAVCNCQRHEH